MPTIFSAIEQASSIWLGLVEFWYDIAKSCTLSAVADSLAALFGWSFNTVRERLRDTYRGYLVVTVRGRRSRSIVARRDSTSGAWFCPTTTAWVAFGLYFSTWLEFDYGGFVKPPTDSFQSRDPGTLANFT